MELVVVAVVILADTTVAKVVMVALATVADLEPLLIHQAQLIQVVVAEVVTVVALAVATAVAE
jgi:hypothetical protein